MKNDSNILGVLKDRGLVAQESHEGKVAQYLEGDARIFYVGFDPTAESLHIGHLVAVMCMRTLVDAGHKAICLIGGGTALIGDPSHKTEMRKMINKDELEKNRKALAKQMSKLLNVKDLVMLNNADWLFSLNYLDFMREYGVHFKINEMIKKDIYKERLDREEGLTMFELNYLLLQSYDYLHLFRKYGCTLELGGSDQWSNILGGVELIHKIEGQEVYAVTWPLVTRSDGKKMGKSESGAVWLDEEKTSVYDFYQWWINVPDLDVEKFLKIFTFLEISVIKDLVEKDIVNAKKTLAYEVTAFVHSKEKAKEVKEQSEKIFEEGDLGNAPVVSVESSLFENEKMNLVDILVSAKIAESKSKARKLIEEGGLYLNDERMSDQEIEKKKINLENFVLRVGKKKYYRVKAV